MAQTIMKKVNLFLIIFKPEVRGSIVIKEPKDRQIFTLNECELVNGYPFNPEDQDDYQQHLMIPEDKEIIFWNKYNNNHDGNIIKQLEDIEDPSLPNFDEVLAAIPNVQ